eukprot:5646025-Pyramimonas_sp.AAC.1
MKIGWPCRCWATGDARARRAAPSRRATPSRLGTSGYIEEELQERAEWLGMQPCFATTGDGSEPLSTLFVAPPA